MEVIHTLQAYSARQAHVELAAGCLKAYLMLVFWMEVCTARNEYGSETHPKLQRHLGLNHCGIYDTDFRRGFFVIPNTVLHALHEALIHFAAFYHA